MNHIFEPRLTGTTGTTGNGLSTASRTRTGPSTANSHSNLPTSLVNEHAQINAVESNLDEINIVADDDVDAADNQ